MDFEAETKRCPKCGERKPVGEFWRKTGSPDGRQCHCKACQRAQQAARSKTEGWKRAVSEWRKRNPDKVYASRTPERVRVYNLKWRTDNPDKWREIQRKREARQALELSDRYVKGQVARGQFPTTMVPDGLIAAKRAQLKLRRLLKEK
jgi:hypothetical protein